MNKQELIEHLQAMCASWGEVYELVKDNKQYFGWFIAYDGESIYDMYLTDCDPRGDESGEVVGYVDFKVVITR